MFAEAESVSEEEVQAFVFRKLADGLGRKTVHDILAVLKSILKYGAKHNGTPVPDWDITFPTSTAPKLLPTLSLTDHRKLLKYLADNASGHTVGVMLSLCTGMRIGEVCALRWTDIDFCRRVITVGQTAGRVYDVEHRRTERIISTPKTRTSNREIPICPMLYHALCAVRRTGRGEYVVGAGGAPCDSRSYREYFARLLKRLGIPNIVFHGLRHTFATRCIESLCDYKTVSVILGHSNVTTTLNLYVHPNLDQKKRCMDRMLRYVGKNV